MAAKPYRWSITGHSGDSATYCGDQRTGPVVIRPTTAGLFITVPGLIVFGRALSIASDG